MELLRDKMEGTPHDTCDASLPLALQCPFDTLLRLRDPDGTRTHRLAIHTNRLHTHIPVKHTYLLNTGLNDYTHRLKTHTTVEHTHTPAERGANGHTCTPTGH